MKRRDDQNQLRIDWASPQAAGLTPAAATGFPDPITLIAQRPQPLVQRLPWDFSTTFPQPTDEAVDAGVIDESDCRPDNIRSLHEDYARECLATLKALDTVMDARRRKVDPATGKPPMTHAAAERLRKLWEDEPDRLDRAYRVLIETYESGFGPEAAQAFSKFIRARHAGIEVVADMPAPAIAEPPPTLRARKRAVTTLPVPKPLAAAVAASHFGQEQGKPINPSAAEVRAITENHIERIIDFLQALKEVERSLASPQCNDAARLEGERARLAGLVNSAVELYAGSFGEEAAKRLDAYARRQLMVGAKTSRGQSR